MDRLGEHWKVTFPFQRLIKLSGIYLELQIFFFFSSFFFFYLLWFSFLFFFLCDELFTSNTLFFLKKNLNARVIFFLFNTHKSSKSLVLIFSSHIWNIVFDLFPDRLRNNSVLIFEELCCLSYLLIYYCLLFNTLFAQIHFVFKLLGA